MPRYSFGNRIGKRQILKKMIILSVDAEEYCRSYHILLRVLLNDNNIMTAFITAGNKLTPTKKGKSSKKKTKAALTIPRSELFSIQERIEILFRLLE